MAFWPSEPDVFSLVGVVQLPPMPGYPGLPGIEEIIDFTIEEVLALERSGFNGVLIENRGDRPSPSAVSEGYIHNMARVAQVIKHISSMKVGLSILHDAHASIMAAYVAQADFTRVCIPVTGVHGFCRLAEKAQLGSPRVGTVMPAVFTNMSRPSDAGGLRGKLEADSGVVCRHDADVVVVATPAADVAPTVHECRVAKRKNPAASIFVGSGFNVAAVDRLCAACDGALVDSAIQVDGRCSSELCRRLVAAVRENRQELSQSEADVKEQGPVIAA